MTNAESDYDIHFDGIGNILDSIANDDESPRNVKRASLIALEKLDTVRGYINRTGLRARLNAIKVKRQPGDANPTMPFQAKATG